MQHHRPGNSILRASLLVATALLAGFVLCAAQSDPDAKINRWLINTLVNSNDGSAPFFVVFGERTPLAAAHRITDWAARGHFVVESLQATAERSQAGVRGYLKGHTIAYTPYWIVNQIYIPEGTLELARDLARRPEVAAIVPEEVYLIPPAGPSAGTESIGWNISKIGADQVWTTYGNKGTGIVVANIDTGVQYTHPALVNQYRGNLGGGTFNHSGNWFDATLNCGSAPCDTDGHGTHTMGTMVGGNQIGVAPGAKWIACKACTSGACNGFYLMMCAQWILAPGQNPANRPHIVNNSWGGGGGDTWYQSYVQQWAAAGIFPSFSIGNSDGTCGSAGSPGDYPESIATGATDSADGIASWSARGPSAFGAIIKPDLSAPGVNIYSSVPNGYGYMSGTSMASPHTAGTVALLWAVTPGYLGNISATRTLIQSNTQLLTTSERCGDLPSGVSPNNTFGYGRIDAKKTVDASGPAPDLPPTVTITTPAADGQQFTCGTRVNFAAEASDKENGDLTGSIQWSGPGTPATGSGGTIAKTFDCTSELGNQTVTARVIDTAGLSATDTVVVNIVNPSVPAAPSNLTARAGVRSVSLKWNDNANNETAFKVYRRKQSGRSWGPWTAVMNIAVPNTTSATDSSVSSGTYQYYVTAFAGTVESAPSNTAQVKVR